MGLCACIDKNIDYQSTVIPVEDSSDSIISKYIRNDSKNSNINRIQPIKSSSLNFRQGNMRKMTFKTKCSTVKMRHSTFLNRTELNIKVYGQAASGKTSFIRRLSENTFNTPYIPSINKEMIMQRMSLNSRLYDLKISIVQDKENIKDESSSAESIDYHLIIFDLSKRKGFEYVRKVISDIKGINDANNVALNIILIGNKGDLPQEISNEEIDSSIKESSLLCFKISIKESIGINAMMNTLLNSFDKDVL